jgi:hypothetical protein
VEAALSPLQWDGVHKFTTFCGTSMIWDYHTALNLRKVLSGGTLFNPSIAVSCQEIADIYFAGVQVCGYCKFKKLGITMQLIYYIK